MSKNKRSKFVHGLGQGFAAALKKGVDASVARRGLAMGKKTQDWLDRKRVDS